MHRVETDPDHEPIQQHLNTFASTFPEDFVSLPERLRAVLSYEGIIQEDAVRSRRETFQAQLRGLRPSLGKLKWNASSHPDLFQSGRPETAWRAVVELFATTERPLRKTSHVAVDLGQCRVSNFKYVFPVACCMMI